MNEYQLRDIGQQMTANMLSMSSQQGDYIAIYVSVVFAFIAATYVAGREFNRVQTTIATALFCMVCLWLVYRITMLGLGINFMLEIAEREFVAKLNAPSDAPSWEEALEGNLRVLLTAGVWSLGMIGALIFLWDVRHRRPDDDA